MDEFKPVAGSGKLGVDTPKVESTGRKSGGKPTEGRIASEIGSGDNANNSFIYITIKWGFLIGVGTSAAFFAQGIWLCEPKNLLDTIKDIWGIFMPVITLALGYAFGKGKQA